MKIQRFSSKTPSEVVLLEFDFSKLCSSISSATISVTQSDPDTEDPGITSIPEGTVKISGAKVQHSFKAGLNGYDYVILCSAETTEGYGQTFELSGLLPVRLPRE
jgi:hypothetical protein